MAQGTGEHQQRVPSHVSSARAPASRTNAHGSSARSVSRYSAYSEGNEGACTARECAGDDLTERGLTERSIPPSEGAYSCGRSDVDTACKDGYSDGGYSEAGDSAYQGGYSAYQGPYSERRDGAMEGGQEGEGGYDEYSASEGMLCT